MKDAVVIPPSRLSFVGDYLPDVDFDRVGPWSSDALVANLEAVILEPGAAVRPKAYSVAVGPEAFERVRRSKVSAFNLANNHVYDAGSVSFDQMVRRLAGISGAQFYGLRDRPHAVISVGDTTCAVIGCLERCRARGPALFPEEEVESLVARLRGQYDRVYVTPHWSKEGELALHPGPHQRTLARRWVEAGADGVFGHHSHTIHGRETIEGSPIYYSLGNYQFDHAEGRSYPAAAWGMVVRVDPRHAGSPEQVEFFIQEGGTVIPVDAAASRLMHEHLEHLSSDLSSASRSEWSWARAVGPVFIAKCRKSWNRRLRASPARSIALWAAWNLMPRTMLFRLGCLVPDRRVSEYRELIDRRMVEERRRLLSVDHSGRQ